MTSILTIENGGLEAGDGLVDFYKVIEKWHKNDIEIYPDFLNATAGDLLVKGHDFYAVWSEEKGLWSTDIYDVQRVVDGDLWSHADRIRKERGPECSMRVKTLESDMSGMWARFTQFLKRHPDTDVRLDEKLTFQNTKVKKKDYISRRLPYSLESGDYSAWDILVGKLYDPKEREKIEWMIGAIVSGDSKNIQKFFVFYGEAGSGKSTIIGIIQKLFEGYYVTFDAKALGSPSNQFATEAFRTNPLLAIQHDGDLSQIEDNSRLNSIVSHEMMTIKEKYKSEYMARANCFLIMGTNRPVKITDGKSGLMRRLIDIHPTGKKFPIKEYDALMSQIEFELGAIAEHCLKVYRDLGKNYYNGYSPKIMIEKTNLFYNFVWEKLADEMEKETDGISLKRAYEMYREYCSASNIDHPMLRPYFREELKNYFDEFLDQKRIGTERFRSWYSGFRFDKLDAPVLKKEEHSLPLVLDNTKSLLDELLAECPAQYAKEDGSPEMSWSMVGTKLKDLDTSRVHYVLIGEKNHIVIDFDLKNEAGEKDMLKNLEAASKFPPTYAEFSKGGSGVHLHYIYDGDVDKLAVLYAPGIEIKVFRGLAALRRRVSKCNDVPVAVLNGGLPLKEEKVIDVSKLKDQEHLVNIIKKCLRKEVEQPFTRPCIDLIAKVLDDAYESGMDYDVRDMENDIFQFALQSSHQADYCVKQIKEMKLCSQSRLDEEAAAAALVKAEEDDKQPIIFFDCEVFPNLFLVNWKEEGEGKPVHRMINPTPSEIEVLLGKKLVGFNCRKYDNHMLYACYLGYTTEQIFDLSQRIIVEGAREAFFPEAYNISYTDILDFSSKKQNLKKWEIELGIHHKELGLPWNKPVPESQWHLVAEYCDNDVIATEAVWNARQEDWKARQILADIAGGNVNDTTNQLTLKLVFGNEKKPMLVYTDLATGEQTIGR